ncbi:MAG: 2OG-Fe(II) oxygenase [Tistlia sp.]|uniref:2OG-Fe(II) oxygenase n=1 Tax=Tistlia sp. TaxID=3057121 RepID=UPI0034A241F8
MRQESTAAARVAALDWAGLAAGLDAQGFGLTGPLLTPGECRQLAALYERPAGFRKTVVMARHGYGQGEYRYFDAPLPGLVEALRSALYERLAPIAEAWRRRLGLGPSFPARHADYLARCHAAGQTRPTPLLLRYGPGDYNCLHRDLYGELVFPLQATLLLSPESDFEGGEFLLVEQRPRRQSIGRVAPLRQGEAVLFPVAERPVEGTRGAYRAQLRHGVSPLRRGHRMTLGLIFHDARS